MSDKLPRQPSFLAELQRRNVPRAAVLYAGTVWALAQGIAQLGPLFDAPNWAMRAFVIACVIGFPFWIAFAWIYEFTPQGFKRDSDLPPDTPVRHSNARKLDFAIIAVLVVAVILLLTNTFVWHKGIAPGPSSLEQVVAKVPQKSVAVLPFANEGAKSEQFFSDGLSEDLITALSQFDGLKVISRNSAFQFRDSKDTAATIGRLLGVAHLLEGSVQRAGDEVRITATLVNASDGTVVWTRRYDKPYKDLFALQDAITQAVADALKAKLMTAPGAVVQSDRPPSGNLEAYTAYQHGLAYYALGTEASFHQAIAAFHDAIRLDPKYAAAYAQLSYAWTGLVIEFVTDPAQIEAAKTNARKASATALQLDPDSALAHLIHGSLLRNVDFDWTGAEAEYRRALQLAPNDAAAQFSLGGMSATLGQNRQAVALARKALAADPRHSNWYNWLSVYLAALGQGDAAQQAITTAIALQPGAAWYPEQLAIVEILRGDTKAALAAAHQESDPSWREIALALALQIGSDHAAADAALATLIKNQASVASYQIAEVYALRRDPDAMFQWLDHAWTIRDAGVSYLLMDPLILRYKDDPRFAALCKQVGLPTTTDAVAMK